MARFRKNPFNFGLISACKLIPRQLHDIPTFRPCMQILNLLTFGTLLHVSWKRSYTGIFFGNQTFLSKFTLVFSNSLFLRNDLLSDFNSQFSMCLPACSAGTQPPPNIFTLGRLLSNLNSCSKNLFSPFMKRR